VTAPADVRQVLIDARALLVERGWRVGGPTLGGAIPATGPVCAGNACLLAGEKSSGWGALHDLRLAVGEYSLTLWNDSQTSVEPVLAAFDRAIEALGGRS